MKTWAPLLLIVVSVAAIPQDERQYLPPEENTETKESRKPSTSAASPRNDVASPEVPKRFSASYSELADPVGTQDRYRVTGESDKQINNFAQTNEYRPGYNNAYRDEGVSNERYNSGRGDLPSYSYNDRNTNSEAGEQYDLNRNRFQESPSFLGRESETRRPSAEYGGYDVANEVKKPYDNTDRNRVLAEEPNKRLSQDPSISPQQYSDRDTTSFGQNSKFISNNERGYQHSRNENLHSVPQNSYNSEERPQGHQTYKNDQHQPAEQFEGYNAVELNGKTGYGKGRPDAQTRGYTSPNAPINQSERNEFSETFPNQDNIQNNPNSQAPSNQTPASLYGSPSFQPQQDPEVSNRDRPQTSDSSEVELLEQNQYTSPREKLQSSGDRFQSSNTQSLGYDRQNNQEAQYNSRNRVYSSDDSSYPSRDTSGKTDRLGSSNDDQQRISDSRYTDQTSEYRPSKLSTSRSEENPQGQQETRYSQNNPSSVSEFNEETSNLDRYNAQSDTSSGSQTSTNGQRQPYQNEIPELNTNFEGLQPQGQDSSVNQNLKEGTLISKVNELTNFQDTPEALNGDKIQYNNNNNNNNNNRGNNVGPSAVPVTPQIGIPNALNDATISQPFDPLYKPAQYEFDYRVLFPPTATDFGHHERRVDSETQGEYFVLLPDGRTQVVEYEADEDGYKPNIRYEGVISNFRLGLNRLRF